MNCGIILSTFLLYWHTGGKNHHKHNLSFTLTTLTMILSVENNCLLVLPNDVGNLAVLQQANFNNNQIHYIPPAIKGCQELRILGGFRKKGFFFNFGNRFPFNRPIFVTKRLNEMICWIEHSKMENFIRLDKRTQPE